jgi:hypothetical protein
MRKIITILMAAVFFLTISAPVAFAGSKQRYRWQGVAIGLGAAILGNAILNSDRYDSPPDRVVVIDRDCRKPRYCDRDYRRGQWEIRKIWVEPVCERVWNPGHYNRHHQWVPGQYITIEKSPGYWEEKRVWVGCR